MRPPSRATSCTTGRPRASSPDAPTLAASLLEQVTDGRFMRKALAVTTSEGAPTPFQLIHREGLKAA
jgi:hypothetical protein